MQLTVTPYLCPSSTAQVLVIFSRQALEAPYIVCIFQASNIWFSIGQAFEKDLLSTLELTFPSADTAHVDNPPSPSQEG